MNAYKYVICSTLSILSNTHDRVVQLQVSVAVVS